MYMYKLCKTALIYNSNNTYSMESFHKSYVTNAVVCVEPWIKILQQRFTCRKKKKFELTSDYIQNTNP